VLDKEFIFTLKEISVAGTVILGSLITIGGMVYKIYRQLSPNSGSSLRDQIDYIRIKTDKIALGQKVYLDNIEDTPMFFTDGTGKCEWVNKAYLNLLDKPMSEIVGSNWACSVHQDDRDKIEQEWNRTTERGRNFDMVYRFIDSENKTINVHCRAWGDEKVGYVGIIAPIENQKKLGNSSQLAE
jgi:PAS domain-containing protein